MSLVASISWAPWTGLAQCGRGSCFQLFSHVSLLRSGAIQTLSNTLGRDHLCPEASTTSTGSTMWTANGSNLRMRQIGDQAQEKQRWI